jgi:hypothetical protein
MIFLRYSKILLIFATRLNTKILNAVMVTQLKPQSAVKTPAMTSIVEEITQSKERSRAFLQEAGIITAGCRIAAAYRKSPRSRN